MTKIKKIMIRFIGIFCLLFIMSNIITYAVSDKNIFEVFFPKNETYKTNDLLEYSGETKNIGDYTFELYQELYDSKSGIGYLIFKITKKDGCPEIILNKDNQCMNSGFGENERFDFDLGVSFDDTYQIKGDVLYAYISFVKMIDDELNIRLVDAELGKKYSFQVKETSHTKTFKAKESVIEISPLGVSIFSKKEKEIEIQLVLFMSDGTHREIINTRKNIGTSGSLEGEERLKGELLKYQYVSRFKQMIDISKIEKIEFNGEILTVEK